MRAPHRSDGHLFGVEAAVLAAVGQFPAPDLAGGNGLPQVPIKRFILFAAFQQARVLAQDFLRGVAGQRGEGGVDRLDRADWGR